MLSKEAFDHYLKAANSTSPPASGSNQTAPTPTTCTNEDNALNRRTPTRFVPPPIPAPVSVVTIVTDSAYVNNTPSNNSTATNMTSHTSTSSFRDSPISQYVAPPSRRFLSHPTTSVNSSDSSDSSDNEDAPPALLYHHIFTQNDNSLKVLVAMSYGLKDDDGALISDFENDPLFTKSTRKRQMIPVVDELIDEIVRRKEFSGEKSKTNKQRKKADYLEWLRDNVDMACDNEKWAREKITWLRGILSSTIAPDVEDAEKFINFRGDKWILRLIHALFDHDNAKEAMLGQFNALTRQELDGRANEHVRRRNAYQVIADNYNYDMWGCHTTAYPNLHPDFQSSHYITWEDVEAFGPIDAMKVKNKFTSMTCKLNIIKANYDASGNGVGNRMSGQSDENLDPDTMPDLGAADDRMNFLGGERCVSKDMIFNMHHKEI